MRDDIKTYLAFVSVPMCGKSEMALMAAKKQNSRNRSRTKVGYRSRRRNDTPALEILSKQIQSAETAPCQPPQGQQEECGMKRMLSVLLCAMMLGGLAGCSGIGGPASRQESSAASQEESVGSQISVESSEETAPETPWRYTAENPKEWDLAAALANFTRQLSLEELLASLPNSTIPEAPEGAIMKQVYSEGWSFFGTEGVLTATYEDDPEGEGILLSTLDYWALNYKLQTYAKILDGINAMKLPGVENYEQLPLALTDIFLNEQGGYLPIEEYSEPYLPTNANTYGATLLADGAGEKAYAIECIFWSGDKAEKFCPNPLKKDAPEVLSGIMIRLSYTTDVGV